MSDHPSSSLLGSTSENDGPDQHQHHDQAQNHRASTRSIRSISPRPSTPLLSQHEDAIPGGAHDDNDDDDDDDDDDDEHTSLLRSVQGSSAGKGTKRTWWRWPIWLALGVLVAAVIVIIVLGFLAPSIAREYATQALVVEPTDLSVDSFTANGVRARVQARVRLDASRVRQQAIRNLGRAGTWIAGEVETEETLVKVYIPEYGDVLLGVASLPRIVLDIRNGHGNNLDFMTDVQPGTIDGIRTIANDWLDGRLGQLRVQAKVALTLKSGLLPLGKQIISESFSVEGQSLYRPSFGPHASGLGTLSVTVLTRNRCRL